MILVANLIQLRPRLLADGSLESLELLKAYLCIQIGYLVLPSF